MATKLDKPLKRELDLNGEAHIIVMSPEGLKITIKGRRKGLELSWKDILANDPSLGGAGGGDAGE